MDDKVLGFVAGAVAGLMFGYLFGGAGGPSDTPVADGFATQSAALEGIEANVNGLNERLAAMETNVAAQVADQIAALSAKVDAMPDSVMAGVADSTAGLQASISGEIAALSGALGDTAASAPAAPVAAATSGQSASATAASAESDPLGKGVGQTVFLLDGAARIFISSIDANAGTARVAINGLDNIQTVGGWHKATFSANGKQCTLAADDIASGKVALSAACN